MRLICPNCGAQYEVSDDVIPPGGRDVQCSACNHTWFETPDNGDEDDYEDEVDFGAETGMPPEAPAPDEIDDQEDVPEDEPEAVAEAPAAQPAVPSRSALSPEIAEILREEAAREEAARRSETPPALESQSELGLEQGFDREEQHAEEARRRMARLRGEAAPGISAVVPAANAARRELLPDIEEINSTLTATTEREGAAPPVTVAKRRRGFRTGFVTVIALAVILSGVYGFAPEIGRAVPQVEPALTSYVAAVDEGRLWLDLQMQDIIERLSPSAPQDAPVGAEMAPEVGAEPAMEPPADGEVSGD